MRKRREFRAVQERSRRVTTPHFVFLLHARAEAPESAPRLGITVTRRIGSAPVRNRAKRLVREAFRSTRELFRPGFDVVVVVRRPAEGMRLADVVAEWVEAASAISRALAGRMLREGAGA